MNKIKIILGALVLFAASNAQAQWFIEQSEQIVLTPVKHEQRVRSRLAARAQESDNALEETWETGKNALSRIGLEAGADVSYTFQRAAPDGKRTAIQGVYYPYLTWNLFKDSAFGSGQLNANYTLVRYWGDTAAALQARTPQAVAFNDYPVNQEIFSQLSYTHTLPDNLDWLSLTIGQFPLYNFDGTTYMDNQQTGLMHYSLSQNASAVYPSASLGAYVQAQNKHFNMAFGYQDATNITGEHIELNTAFDGKYTLFGSVGWTPSFDFGAGQYSVLYYYQPAVEKQNENVNGWSFNMQQNIGEKFATFARVNGSDKGVSGVKNSYAIGSAFLDPLDRNPNDAIISGMAYNRLSSSGMGYPPYMRPEEIVTEIQWVWGFGKLLTITPDFQMSPRGALSKKEKTTYTFGLRVTLML